MVEKNTSVDFCSNLQKYPDTDYVELKKSASEYYTIPSTQIAVGAGIDSLIVFSLLAFGEYTILCCPTFEVYQNCLDTFKKKYIPVDFGPTYNVKAAQILKYYTNKTSVIVICNPNNPTGTIVKREEILEILESMSCVVILDEAYAELAGVNNLDLVKTYDNLIILRSLSKAFSVPGIRVGFAFGHEKIISKIEAVRKNILPFCIPVLSEQAAIAVLKNKNYPKKNKVKTESLRLWLQQELNDFKDLKIYPSSTNFLLVEARSSEIQKKLNSTEAINCSKYGLPSTFFRITCTEKESLQMLLEALR